ncbi:MAG: BrnT family toxin [Hyphomicrobiales bacterium]
MDFDWDEEKRAANIAKHGVDFLRASLIFDGPVMEVIDDRENYGEERMVALGMAVGTVYRVVYTTRQSRIRIIGARKASRNEQQIYYRSIFGG